jgi:hypothetical protein
MIYQMNLAFELGPDVFLVSHWWLALKGLEKTICSYLYWNF